MNNPPATRLRRLAVVGFAALVSLGVCLLAMRAVPASWDDTGWPYQLAGSEVYTAAAGEHPGRVRYAFTYAPIGHFIKHSVRVTIELNETPPWTNGPDPRRDAALERVRTAFVKDCNDSGLSELNGLFDAVWSAPNHTAVYAYPWRRQVNAALWVAVVVTWLSTATVAWCLLQSLWLVPQWALQRRRGRLGLCLHCGYNRTGIDSSSPCPECGMA